MEAEQSTAESQRAAPTQPMAEPEAVMGDCGCRACEMRLGAEIMSLEGHTAERITFGVVQP